MAVFGSSTAESWMAVEITSPFYYRDSFGMYVLKGKREHGGIASLLNLSQAMWQHNTYVTLHPV